jgi:hypothetical protein
MTARSNGKNRALVLCLLACVFLLSTPSVHPQSKNNDPHTTRVVLRILNGKTGLPVWAELPNVWLGGANSPIDPPPRTNLRGEIKLEMSDAGPRELRFLPNWYVDCRSTGDQMAGNKLKYSVDEILANGIVAENVCGMKRGKPTPGVLILYVRPRTWLEIMAL